MAQAQEYKGAGGPSHHTGKGNIDCVLTQLRAWPLVKHLAIRLWRVTAASKICYETISLHP